MHDRDGKSAQKVMCLGQNSMLALPAVKEQRNALRESDEAYTLACLHTGVHQTNESIVWQKYRCTGFSLDTSHDYAGGWPFVCSAACFSCLVCFFDGRLGVPMVRSCSHIIPLLLPQYGVLLTYSSTLNRVAFQRTEVLNLWLYRCTTP